MNKRFKVLIVIGFFAWLCKHFLIYPTIGEDRDISGFEFRIRW